MAAEVSGAEAAALVAESAGARFSAGAAAGAGADVAERPWGTYVHVPYCASRCGYCDFNTYTAVELGPGVGRADYPWQVVSEIEAAGRALRPEGRQVSTVFFGGGTPTLLPAADLVAILGSIEDTFGLEPDAEVTTEANPDSVDAGYLAQLHAGGFTRISLGMQSASPTVLAVLERTHTAGAAERAVADARAAGFDQVSLDLIYGTPGETPAMWRESLERAVATGVDHISAYALTVEPTTRLGRRISRGQVSMPDPDVAADRYEAADDILSTAGLRWYEISNWARPGAESRHNLGYWRGQDWWGFGPGAHGHLAGLRWWNVRHPRDYAARISTGLPVAGAEILSDREREIERRMLGIRLAEGLPVGGLDPEQVARIVTEGLARQCSGPDGSDRMVLTRRGRLLADAVTRELLGVL